MEPYLKCARTIDKVTNLSGKIISYLVYPLMFTLAYETVVRYLFHAPTTWAFDVTYMLSGTIFMLGAPYTLLKKGHIRTDLFYDKWSPEKQGKVDALFYLFLFFPGMILYLVYGAKYAAFSWSMKEKAFLTPLMPIIYPFKTVIPVTIFLLLIQGISEFIKSVHAWKKGKWI